MSGWKAKAAAAVTMLGLTALAGCGGAPGEGGSSLSNMVLFASPTVPPPMQKPTDDVYCPTIEVMDGGAAVQAYAGGVGNADRLRSQVSLGDLARECVGRPDGSTVVKVGVEGLVLLGPGGAPGRYDAPVHIVVRGDGGTFADRTRRASVAIPSGASHAAFTVVEEGIVVPAAGANTFKIEVGLGGGGGRRARR